MIVSVRAIGGFVGLAVDELDDLGRLKVVVDAPDVAAACQAIGSAGRFESPEVAWLDIRALRALAGRTDPEWGSGFDAMVEYAAVHGWLSPDGTSVRAHSEWRSRPEAL